MKFIQYAILAIALAVELLEASPAPSPDPACGPKCKKNRRNDRKNRDKKIEQTRATNSLHCTRFADQSGFLGIEAKFNEFTAMDLCMASDCARYEGSCIARDRKFLCANDRASFIDSCIVAFTV
jgi:hypothetical protein